MKPPTGPAWFAWCFDHGRMHTFVPRGEEDAPEGAWCTAGWVKLDGATEEEATTDKVSRFGDARFAHQLPSDTQIVLIREWSARRGW